MPDMLRVAAEGCFSVGAALALLLSLTGTASADTETWDFDLQTSGEDVFWTSPTTVCNAAPQYDGAYEITLVEVTVSYLGFTFGPFDVTNEIPPEQRSGSGTFPGPPPLVVVDGHLRYPPPPEPVSLAAHLLIEVDADGYGHVSATDVELGTITYDLGWPFGIVTVQLETMRVAGTVWVTPVIPGDIDDDCDVDLHDLATLLASYGLCEGDPAYDPAADLNDSGCVDLVDLALLLVNYGLGM